MQNVPKIVISPQRSINNCQIDAPEIMRTIKKFTVARRAHFHGYLPTVAADCRKRKVSGIFCKCARSVAQVCQNFACFLASRRHQTRPARPGGTERVKLKCARRSIISLDLASCLPASFHLCLALAKLQKQPVVILDVNSARRRKRRIRRTAKGRSACSVNPDADDGRAPRNSP